MPLRLEQPLGAEAGEDQVGIVDVVDDADVDVDVEPVRGLDVGGAGDVGLARRLLARAGQVDHLQVLGEEVHALEVERLEDEVEAGVVDVGCTPGVLEQRHAHDLDAVLVGADVGEAGPHRDLEHGDERRAAAARRGA